MLDSPMLKFMFFFLYHKFRRFAGSSKVFQPIGLRFCAENKIDPTVVHADQVFSLFGHYDHRPLAQQIDALVIPKRKRFGNALLQLADAYNIARYLGVKKIYHRGYSFLKDVAFVEGIEFVKGVPKRSENYMIGDYYQNNDLLNICTTKLDRWQIMHAMADHMTFAMAANETSPQEQQALYIHLRSGDIFKKTPRIAIMDNRHWRFIKKLFGPASGPRCIWFLKTSLTQLSQRYKCFFKNQESLTKLIQVTFTKT